LTDALERHAVIILILNYGKEKAMKLVLSRILKNPTATIGTLTVNGLDECFTLENPAVQIPTGSYPITVYFSPHAGHSVPLLQDVPDRDYIEIHCGNLAEDSKGCVLVGQGHTQDTLENSRLAFDHLMPQIQAAFDRHEQISIDVL
jgi:hypothetical protein